ncbi:MAG: tetratricopeptide repeat protein, partial [Bacteroidota bacterium]
MKIASIVILCLLCTIPCDAQLKNLGKKLKQKAQQVIEQDNQLFEQGEELARERMADKQAEFDTTSFNYAIAFLDKAESFENQQQGEKLVRTAGFLIEKEGTDTEEAREIYEQGRALYNVRSYSLAEKYLGAAVLAYALMEERDHPVFLKSVGLLGLLFNNMGRYDLADTANAFALAGWERTLGEGSRGYAAEFNNKAVITFNRGDYNEAERLFREALRLTQAAEGVESVPLAIS